MAQFSNEIQKLFAGHREAVLRQVREQALDPANNFGFPDKSLPRGVQPAVNIYAWNEYGEGGIMAPTQGDGYMKLETIAKVFGTGASDLA